MSEKISVIGGGLAGVEAAFQISRLGVHVDLYEMRPETSTPAHTTALLGEMVCSNSLGSTELTSASGLLKEELKRIGSFFLALAESSRVPAGSSFSVDRIRLAEEITREIGSMDLIHVIHREITDPNDLEGVVIAASGPLTSDALAASLSRYTMRRNLFFFDATCPIVRSDSIDYSQIYRASRYNKGSADFINIPLSEAQYGEFVEDLVNAEKVDIEEFEKDMFFESCLPIEEIARRGRQALSFGTLKPVGLVNPATGDIPHAVVQLRQDDLQENFYQIVGFQTRLKQGEQKRIFRKLPGLKNAHFERYGRMHRNTYINAPLILNRFFQMKTNPRIFFAGQICGVEGYVESIASGMACGIYAGRFLREEAMPELPRSTALGSLVHYITQSNWKEFRPTKFTFGLLPDGDGSGSESRGRGRRNMTKKRKKELKAQAALELLEQWKKQIDI